MQPRQSYALRIAVWLDNGLNVWLSPFWNHRYSTDRFGYPDECVSSVLGKLQRAGHDNNFRKVVDWVFLHCFKQENHCINNIEEDEGIR